MSRLRQLGQILLHLEDTPHRTALAFGLGVFIAFSPLLGIHWVLALAAAFAFRLNRVAVLLGTYVNNPWTLAPFYLAGTALGCALLRVSPDGLSSIEWHRHGWDFYTHLFAHLRPFLWPYVLGNTVLGTVCGALTYLVVRAIIERRRKGSAAPPAPLATP
jgi:uncharacterized protein (DUF2062 family)